METIITLNLPIKRIQNRHWLFSWGGGSVQEFGGSRVNTVRHLFIFKWHILTIRRNQYHDQSDKERADEYLRKWSECEKELRGLRLLVMGDETNSDVKKLIKESLGIDLDEGRVL